MSEDLNYTTSYGRYFSRKGYFDSASLYRQPRQKYLNYLAGFCAFVFMLVISGLASLILWEKAGVHSDFKYSEFYILLPPTQFLLGVILAVVLVASFLMINMICRAVAHENHGTLQLLVAMGADKKYISSSFHRAIFKHNIMSIFIGATAAGVLLWGFRIYWLWFFSKTHSLLPKIGAMDYWLLMFWLLTFAVYGILLMFSEGRVIRSVLFHISSSQTHL